MMKHNVYIKRTLKLIMGISQTLGKRQTHSNNVGLMDHPINIYIIIYLSIWYLYIIQGGEHTGDARLRQHKQDEAEDEEEEDVYGNQQRQRRPALQEEDENVYGNQVLTLLAVLVQKYKY